MPHNYKPKYLILNKTDVRQKRDDLLIEIFTTYLVIYYLLLFHARLSFSKTGDNSIFFSTRTILIVYTHHMNVQLKVVQPYQFYLWIYEHLQSKNILKTCCYLTNMRTVLKDLISLLIFFIRVYLQNHISTCTYM